jgi:hypothetical protein
MAVTATGGRWNDRRPSGLSVAQPSRFPKSQSPIAKTRWGDRVLTNKLVSVPRVTSAEDIPMHASLTAANDIEFQHHDHHTHW